MKIIILYNRNKQNLTFKVLNTQNVGSQHSQRIFEKNSVMNALQ